MSELLETAFDPEEFRKNGHYLVDLLADYLKKCMNGPDFPVLPWKSPDRMLMDWDTNFSKPSSKGLEEFFSSVIRQSIHLHHPQYMGHQVVPPAPMAALMELLSAFLNNSMAVYEVGPLSSAMEKIVIRWLCKALGMTKKAGGVLTSGGSMGNLTGLLAARRYKAKHDIWEVGNRDKYPLAVMVSEEAHYSIARAVKIMGWGEEGLVKIPVNKRKEIDHTELENCFRRARENGKRVIAVVANACTTSTGSYDPLEKIAEFCKKNRLWFHVDAAHGGSAALSKKYKHLVKGIEKADSVVVDFHKMLLCPALTTAVLFKNGERPYQTFSQKASYLLNTQGKGNWFDIAEQTLECTKKMMSIKIYALLRTYGAQLFSDYITWTYDLAKDFVEFINMTMDFEAAMEPAANIVCFRYAPREVDFLRLNDLNRKVREKLKENGEFYIVQTVINGRVYLRVTLMNPFTSRNDLIRLLQLIRKWDTI